MIILRPRLLVRRPLPYPGLTEVLRQMLPSSHVPAGTITTQLTPQGTAFKLTGSDPGFATGRVVARSARMLVLQAGSEQRVVYLPAGCQVWKETQTTPDAIALGDWVDVRGDPQPDGCLLARSGWIWVNIWTTRGRNCGTRASEADNSPSQRDRGHRAVAVASGHR